MGVVELPVYPRATSAVLGLPRATRAYIRRRSADIDVLHLHSVFTPHNVWISRTAGLPFVVTPNGGYNAEVLHGRHRSAKAVWMWMHERRYVRAASMLHAVAPSELGQLRETFGVDELVFAPNGVELPSAVSDPASKTVSSPKRVVFVGRLAVQHKGLDLLVGGYARFADRHADADVELVIAGPDERSGRAQLEALENAQPARRNIRFPGPVFGEAKDDLVRSAWFFVHPSRWEGMPFAVLEALALGVPVLVTPETNLASFVRDAGAGIVIEGSADGVADGLASICGFRPCGPAPTAFLTRPAVGCGARRVLALARSAGLGTSPRLSSPRTVEFDGNPHHHSPPRGADREDQVQSSTSALSAVRPESEDDGADAVDGR